MREQQAQISEVIQGPTEMFIQALEIARGPVQHDAHCKGWRFYLYEQESKRREAATREEGRRIIKQINDEKERIAQAARALAEAAE